MKALATWVAVMLLLSPWIFLLGYAGALLHVPDPIVLAHAAAFAWLAFDPVSRAVRGEW